MLRKCYEFIIMFMYICRGYNLGKWKKELLSNKYNEVEMGFFELFRNLVLWGWGIINDVKI